MSCGSVRARVILLVMCLYSFPLVSALAQKGDDPADQQRFLIARTRVAGKSVRKYTLRLYSFFFKEIEAKSAAFSTPS
jgi:hypothetical protein